METRKCVHVVTEPARTVVVIGQETGPDPGIDIDAVARSVAARNGELVILSVGWPPTQPQRRAVDEAMQAAAERRFACSGHLVWSAEEIDDHLQPGDDVIVMSPGLLPTPEASAVALFA